MTSEIWPPAEYEPLLAEMGRIVFNFNSLERVTHRIVLMLATRGSEDRSVQILITHLNNVPATDALRSLAIDAYDGAVQEHALHLAELFDRLREYRNFYVHGFKDINLGGGGAVSTRTARKGLKYHDLRVDRESMADLARSLQLAHSYAANVYCGFGEILLSRPEVRGLPEKLALPDRLEKPAETIAQWDERKQREREEIERRLEDYRAAMPPKASSPKASAAPGPNQDKP
jgi:hypothetical protein